MTSQEHQSERPVRRASLPPPTDRRPAALVGPKTVADDPRRIGPRGRSSEPIAPLGGLTPIRSRRPAGGNLLRNVEVHIFAGSFVVWLAIAVLIYYGMDIWNADSLSRTIDAQTVLYSRDPHLGAIGFVWPPLPTLARIAIFPITHNLGIAAFTGQLTSTIFAAGCVTVLYRILCTLNLRPTTRIVWMGVALLNPVVILHFTNGTAESAFTLLVLLAVNAALRLPVAPLPAISGMGIAIAAALLVRYEALAIAGTSAVGVLLFATMTQRTTPGRRKRRTEALLVALLFPIVFVGVIWMYFNWSIQGDPLFFYRSVYSVRGAADVARNAPGHVLEYAVHSIPGTMRYVTERTLQASALFVPAVIALAWVAARRRDPIAALLLMMSLSIHAMQAYQAFSGSIAPWLRYWVYLPLLTPIVLGYVLTSPDWSQGIGQRGRSIVMLGVVPALFLCANAISLFAMQTPGVGYDERIFSLTIAGQQGTATEVRNQIPSKDLAEDIAAYLNSTEGTILVDKQRAGLYMLSVKDPSRLMLDSDRSFPDDILDAANTADWVLLPDPADDSEAVLSHDSIYRFYPDLYGGVPWLELEHEFEGSKHWRLFRVVPVQGGSE